MKNVCAFDIVVECSSGHSTIARKGGVPWRKCPHCGNAMHPKVPYEWRGRDALFGDRDAERRTCKDDGTGSRLDRALIFEDEQRARRELES